MVCRCIEWLKLGGRYDLISKPVEQINKCYRICSAHFEVNVYSNPEKTRLLPNATPTIFGMCYLT